MTIKYLEAPAVRKVGVWSARFTTACMIGVTLFLASATLPTLFGYGASVVVSGSMGRAMPVGSIALTRMIPVDDVKPGDVVTFRHASGNAPITHRVVSIAPAANGFVLQTEGDAVGHPDLERVVVSGTIARVAHVVPFAGYVVHFAHTAAGWLLLFALPIAGMLFEYRRPKVRAVPA